jgi:hypothetical protein
VNSGQTTQHLPWDSEAKDEFSRFTEQPTGKPNRERELCVRKTIHCYAPPTPETDRVGWEKANQSKACNSHAPR